MEGRLCLVVVVIVGCLVGNISAKADSESYMRLSSILLNEDNYKSTVKPVPTNGTAVNVSQDITLLRVASLEDQVLTLNTWISMQWNDNRLTWTPAMHDGIKEIRIPSRLLWLPDIILFNSVDEQRSFGSDISAVVNHKGDVTYVPPTITRSGCRVRSKTLKRHHKVVCTLKFGSWTYDKGLIDIYNPAGKLVNEIEAGQKGALWKVLSSSVERKVTQYSCCPEMYVTLDYIITMKYMGK